MSQLDERRCWQAVVDRDGTVDGDFVFGVVTTGVFCRPSCRSRRPLRKNVRFFASPELAEAAGLRACLRCRPAEDDKLEVEWASEVCEFLRQQGITGERLTLASLARRVGGTPNSLRRRFRAIVGVTPKQYLEACRLEAFRAEIRGGGTVTDAVYAAGFGSSSRLYERIDSRFGMTPTQYQQGASGLTVSYAWLDSDLGLILVAATDRGLCAVEFGDSRETLLSELQSEFPAARLVASGLGTEDEQFRDWVEALDGYLIQGEQHPDLPLDIRGSAFRIKVWRYLQSIPRGETRSYGTVAEAVGEPRSARAVAQACAANRLALLVPCHRVIRGNGDLGGYRWGRERKRRLLAEEAR